MNKINHNLNSISNVIGFPENQNDLNVFNDLLKKITPNFTLNIKNETENFHFILSFWATSDIGVQVSKRINYFNKNKSCELNIIIFMPSRKDFKWGIKCKKEIKTLINSKYFDFIDLTSNITKIDSIETYFELVSESIIKMLKEKNMISS